MSDDTIRDIAELIQGLAVPVSLGMGSDGLLGTAYEPWQRLYSRFGSGWSSVDEIEKRLRERLRVIG
jgi:hypothetical protein